MEPHDIGTRKDLAMYRLSAARDRLEAKKYNDGLAKIATEMAMKYFAVVNFVCLPQSEFEQKKTWYAYFCNIASEGKIVERIDTK